VLAQTFQDWELLLVDDASPRPLSLDLQDLLGDSRVRLVRHEKNQGGSGARNTGIMEATGPAIAFLDSDDEWLPEKLAGDVGFMRRQIDSGWFGFGRYWVNSINGRRESVPAPEPMPRLDEYLFTRRGAMQTSSLLVPTSSAQAVLFDPSLPRLQDWDFVLRLWQAGLEPRPIAVRATIYDAPDDAARISNRLDPDFLQRWLDERRSLLSLQAAAGFEANKIAPELVQVGRRREGAALLVQGWRNGVVSPRILAIELLRAGMGDGRFRELMKLRERLRS
jgi:glycosyltransferase involved in cell wall biosynthesis